jgi:MFS family permease
MIASGALYAVGLLGFAVSTSFALSMVVLFVLGIADSGWGAMRNTIAQLATADAYRGRVMSMITVTSRGLTNAGQIETGAIVAAIGPAFGAAINAVLVGISVATVALRSPRLRGFRSAAHVEVDVGEAASP